MRTVTVHEAKTYLACFLDQVAAGEEVIITKAGQPIARLMPADRSEPRAPGIATGRVTGAFFEPVPEEESAAWER